MDRITSRENAKIKHLVQLQTKAKKRREEQVFVIEGKRIVLDAPEGFLLEIFLSESRAGDYEGVLPAVPTFVLPDALFKEVSDTTTPQGILAVARQPKHELKELLSSPSPLILALEDVQDPGNLGTMVRTAEAAGVSGILLSRGCVDLYNPKTVRATMSAIFRVPIVTAEDFHESLQSLQGAGVRLYAAHLEGSVPYDEPDYCLGTCFLIGNEGNGLTPETTALADQRIRIPMQGKIESLNAAMSAGILMYEASRQRRVVSAAPSGCCKSVVDSLQ